MTESAVQFLIGKGASRWTKGDRDRLYLNEAIFSIIGLECGYYNSGSISSATLKGESISNSYARKLLAAADRSYIDMKTDTFFSASGPCAGDLSKMVCEWIEDNK